MADIVPFIFPLQVCQRLIDGDKNAGTEKDTAFSVDDEGNVVVLYGPSKDSDAKRYG